MTHIPDLAPCHYLSDSDRIVAVGWLGAEHEYARGSVEATVFARLVELLVDPWQPVFAAGGHDCELCRFTGSSKSLSYRGTTISYGVSNLFVPGERIIYAAPSMIVHYIDSHGYAPPQQFCDAVTACPEMRSMAYKRALLKNGPKGFATARD